VLSGGFSALNGPANPTDYTGDLITDLRCQNKGTIESSKNDSGDKPQEKRSWKFDNKELILLISGQEGHWERKKTASTCMNHETHLLR